MTETAATEPARRDLAAPLAAALVAAAWVLALVPGHSANWHAAAGILLAVAFVGLSLVWPETAPLAYLGVMPLRDLGDVVPFATTTFATVIAVSGLAGFAWQGLRATSLAEKNTRAVRQPLSLALGGPLAASLLTVPFSIRAERSLRYGVRFLWLWAASLLFAIAARTQRELRRILAWLVAVCTALSGLAALQRGFGSAAPGRVHISMNVARIYVVRPAGFYLDPNFLGVLLAAGALAAATLALASPRARAAGPWAGAAVACVAGVALTGSRTALLALGAGAIVVALTAPRARRAVTLAVLALALVAAVALVPTTLARVTSVASDSSEPSLQTRLLMSESMAQMLPRYWLTGTGLSAFEDAYPAYRRPGALARVVRPQQVPLAVWVETGLPGLAAEVAVLVCAGVAIARRRRSGWRVEDSAVLAALVAVLLGTLFQYFYYYEPLWVLLGLLAGSGAPEASA